MPSSASEGRWPRGRGSASDPPTRFQTLVSVPEPEAEPQPDPRTEIVDDDTRSILSWNESPDVGFRVGINPYRGCEHGCPYCYARAFHEYLDLSGGLTFETRIIVKRRAPALLAEALDGPQWQPQVIGLSGATDCYQPLERRLQLTRACLAVLAACRNPVHVITKNALVVRDRDLLAALAAVEAAVVWISLTTLDEGLARALEPRASGPAARLRAIRALREAGIPVGVNCAPLIPGLTDHELPALLAAARAAGAGCASYQILRLPGPTAQLFQAWLERHAPTRAAVVLERVASCHGGRLDAPPGCRHRGQGPWAAHIAQLFAVHARRQGLDREPPPLSTAAFCPPRGRQQALWDGL
ncbi:MAG: PA0069 family radical SAM protein [Planctomycetota bacterium]|nr:PA0069 family radical SAM protein [Planctomycetota bacterium]MCX8039210.1 PA0069 family radical SAM protein [Planctomycetota bacterium]MDW8373625.1 PA0069 family radical SAM protein [Planctomycetota bacterium]